MTFLFNRLIVVIVTNIRDKMYINLRVNKLLLNYYYYYIALSVLFIFKFSVAKNENLDLAYGENIAISFI